MLEVTKKRPIFFSQKNPIPGPVGNVLDIILMQTLG